TRAERREVDRKEGLLGQLADLLEARKEAEATIGPWVQQRDIVRPTGPVSPAGPVWAEARGASFAESVYRPDRPEISFLRDLVNAPRDGDAQARLTANKREVTFAMGWDERRADEYRDMSNASSVGGEFMPPLYLGDLYVEPNIS